MTLTDAPDAPKYYRIKARVLDLIDGAAPGTLIPPERVLAQRYDTSRTTVRQALTELVAEGRLDRTQGKGTFVAPPKLSHVRQLTSFSEDIRAQGLDPSSKVIRLDMVGADPTTADRLAVPVGRRVHRVERVRYVGNEQLAHETSYLPGSLPRLKAHLERIGSLYAVLREVYRIEIAEVEDSVETMPAGPDDAHLLDVEVGAPMLLVHRLGRDATGTPVEWTRSTFRGDRFRFVARASRVSSGKVAPSDR